jgi:hypothetical protein
MSERPPLTPGQHAAIATMARRQRLYQQRYGWPGFPPTAIIEKTATTPSEPSAAKGDQIPEAAMPDLVTLDQIAAAVNHSKRTLERRKTRGELPPPDVEGGGGRADRWEWSTIRPWLMKTFKLPKPLPERFPGNRR